MSMDIQVESWIRIDDGNGGYLTHRKLCLYCSYLFHETFSRKRTSHENHDLSSFYDLTSLHIGVVLQDQESASLTSPRMEENYQAADKSLSKIGNRIGPKRWIDVRQGGKNIAKRSDAISFFLPSVSVLQLEVLSLWLFDVANRTLLDPKRSRYHPPKTRIGESRAVFSFIPRLRSFCKGWPVNHWLRALAIIWPIASKALSSQLQSVLKLNVNGDHREVLLVQTYSSNTSLTMGILLYHRAKHHPKAGCLSW